MRLCRGGGYPAAHLRQSGRDHHSRVALVAAAAVVHRLGVIALRPITDCLDFVLTD
jgi:hypothetical protein